MFRKSPTPQELTEEIRVFSAELRKRQDLLPTPPCVVRDPILLERKQFHWWSWYPPRAQCQILFEACYLFFFLIIVFGLIWLVWRMKGLPCLCSFVLPSVDDLLTFQKYSFVLLGGVLGGLAFDSKWFYHAVAKGGWHQDRQWWRYMIPPLSGIFALVLFLLIGVEKAGPRNFLAFGFLIGFFSDRAIGKLGELADLILGRSKESGGPASPSGELGGEPAGPAPPAPGQTSGKRSADTATNPGSSTK